MNSQNAGLLPGRVSTVPPVYLLSLLRQWLEYPALKRAVDAQVLKVRRLAAGGRWIRTLGPP